MDGVEISQKGENNMFPMWKRGAHDKGWEMYIAGEKMLPMQEREPFEPR